MLSSYSRFESGISTQLSLPLPGTKGQLQMAPHYRADPEMLSVANKRCKQAAVMLLMLPVENLAHVVLTVRKATLSNHAGQISLPGGRQEVDEELLDTALRETDEEIGVSPSQIKVLGHLSPLYIPPSRYCVYPFVGSITEPTMKADDREVERILLAPAADLLNPTMRRVGTRTIKGNEYDVPYFNLCGEVVWGATAMILAEFSAVIDGARGSDGQAT